MEKTRVGGREDGMPDLADDSVNGVFITIPLSVQYIEKLTHQAELTFPDSFLFICLLYLSVSHFFFSGVRIRH